MGTRFLCSTEVNLHINYKKAVVNSKDRDALVTGRSTGYPVRALKNDFTKEFTDLEQGGASLEELELLGSGRLKLATVEGDIDNGSLMAGQISGLINDIKPCKEIIEDIVFSAGERLNSLYSPREVR